MAVVFVDYNPNFRNDENTDIIRRASTSWNAINYKWFCRLSCSKNPRQQPQHEYIYITKLFRFFFSPQRLIENIMHILSHDCRTKNISEKKKRNFLCSAQILSRTKHNTNFIVGIFRFVSSWSHTFWQLREQFRFKLNETKNYEQKYQKLPKIGWKTIGKRDPTPNTIFTKDCTMYLHGTITILFSIWPLNLSVRLVAMWHDS